MTMPGRWAVWIGRGISALASAVFVMSASMKFIGGEQVAQGMQHLGLPDRMVIPLGILEITCVIVYLIPHSAVLGAILLAGYLGGAICTHWRVGDPVFVQIALGVLVWLGLWLREPRLKVLIPLRSARD